MKRTSASKVRDVSLLWPGPSIPKVFENSGHLRRRQGGQVRLVAFLRDLVDRGLNGVQLIISDACRGLMESAAENLPDARWQCCVVTFIGTSSAMCRPRRSAKWSTCSKPSIPRRTATQPTARPRDRRRPADRPDEHRGRSGRAQRPRDADLLRFPDIHWHKIRTNNPLERIMREIRRRTRVVGAFPDGQSCLNLAAARLRYIAGTAWSAKCYMNMRPLYQPQVVQTEAVA